MLFLRSYQQPTTSNVQWFSRAYTPHRKRSPPLKRGLRSRAEERRDHREYEIEREGETEERGERNLKSEETLIFTPLTSYPLPLIHLVVLSEANSRSLSPLSTLHGSQEDSRQCFFSAFTDNPQRSTYRDSYRPRSGTGAAKWYWPPKATGLRKQTGYS